jgi:alanine-glyoxylate transaminase/serine-glyoxylate transaminase/serine-pyruvate transaminase
LRLAADSGHIPGLSSGASVMAFRSGRHFLNIPGPSNVPDRVARAMDNPVIDHRGPEFAAMTKDIFVGLRRIFKTQNPVAIFPASGTGAWEAALLNTLSPGDKVLAFETGQFATLWRAMAQRHGLVVEFVPGDWRHPADPAECEKRLVADKQHSIKAVMVLHSETSTGVMSPILGIRHAIDRAKHPALLLVDTISSLGTHDYHHDEWGVDVTVGGSQKGFMLPPGLSFNAVSKKALEANKTAKLGHAYFDWKPMLEASQTGFFPFTPPTTLLYGLKESIAMLEEEGLDNVFSRQHRLAESVRRAVRAWGLEILCADPKAYANALTAIVMPEGVNSDEVRNLILERFDLSLGAGLGKVTGKVFRIGHLGWTNDLMIMGALAGIEMGLAAYGVKHKRGGVDAAMEYLAGNTLGAQDSPVAAAARR